MKRVLVVDDDDSVRTMTAAALSQAGFDVATAVDGKKAWTLLGDEPFDAMVVDLNMPIMNGLKLTKLVRESKKLRDLPILMLTIRDLVADELAGYERGVDAYMTKPFDVQMLVARVTALTRQAGSAAP